MLTGLVIYLIIAYVSLRFMSIGKEEDAELLRLSKEREHGTR